MAYFNQERKKEMAPAIKALLKKYDMKGSLAVRHHSTVVLTIKEGPFDFRTNHLGGNINLYFIDENYTGLACEFLTEACAILMQGNHNRSDINAGRFDVGRYVEITVGRWDRPYVVTGVNELEVA